ncbi:hypothetical protein LWI28_025973 [Acer negundo]|uniref:Uncharacterized protein n=1 Tax=Acer negundo TaxID=4023 RepID=A0AAD5IGD7_ACENE|nr:hypothetical protein LWI28_025973 [Acer negundo]
MTFGEKSGRPDHRPLVIKGLDGVCLADVGRFRRGRRFFFEECWASDRECKDIVLASWKLAEDCDGLRLVIRNIEACKRNLSSWNIEKRRSSRYDISKKKEAFRMACTVERPVSWSD